MTLKELEEILGEGQLFIYERGYKSKLESENVSWNMAWKKASMEGRVMYWAQKPLGDIKREGIDGEAGIILAAFTGDPSGDSTVEVLNMYPHGAAAWVFSNSPDVSKLDLLRSKPSRGGLHVPDLQKPPDKWR